MKLLATVLTAFLLLTAPLTGAQAQFVRGVMYEVTITNITRGSLFAPILVASHRSGVSLFALGEPASAELAMLAEGGNVEPLAQALRADSRVVDVANSGGPLEPGQSVTVQVAAQGADHISLAAMIVPTNDGFIALNGVEAPRSGSETHWVPGYDAGSEPNDELCVSIPGPQCGGEGASPLAGGEDFVHVHSGIHGIADLKAEEYDWRNPVAVVTIKKTAR
ncbi:MAG: spondin domain-containing protein [Candidatus Contendobacter sp.]|nr:spondin domain-containing protein [Candidatus Contendobacter sp.]MDS4060134.1 spondin domain-containing protein [Candidatus Contendobacter sp.]